MSNRNRRAGHGFELQVCKWFHTAGYPHVVTARSESRNKDNCKVDLMNVNELDNGRLPYNPQCKNSKDRPKYDQVLKEMITYPGVVNVIFHKYTEKKAGGGFHARGFYAILEARDFMEMVRELKELRDYKSQKEAHENITD